MLLKSVDHEVKFPMKKVGNLKNIIIHFVLNRSSKVKFSTIPHNQGTYKMTNLTVPPTTSMLPFKFPKGLLIFNFSAILEGQNNTKPVWMARTEAFFTRTLDLMTYYTQKT